MMAKATSTKPKATETKPARSKTRAAATKPRAVRKAAKTIVAKTVAPAAAGSKWIKAADSEAEPLELSKKELIERMVEESGMKKGEARHALDAVLTVLGGALAEGANIAAAPLGKIKIARTKDTATGQLVVCRVKLKKPASVSDTSD